MKSGSEAGEAGKFAGYSPSADVLAGTPEREIGWCVVLPDDGEGAARLHRDGGPALQRPPGRH